MRLARSIALVLGMIVPISVTALDQPRECHKIYVNHPQIKVTGRAQRDAQVSPLEFTDPYKPESEERVTELTIRLDRKKDGVTQNVFRMEELTDGWRYIEVRVTTKRETPPAQVPEGSSCIEIIWRKLRPPPLEDRRPMVDPRVFDGGFRLP